MSALRFWHCLPLPLQKKSKKKKKKKSSKCPPILSKHLPAIDSQYFSLTFLIQGFYVQSFHFHEGYQKKGKSTTILIYT